MSVDEFIGAIIQQVPERRLQFKMIRIRYYGSYYRKWKSRYKPLLISFKYKSELACYRRKENFAIITLQDVQNVCLEWNSSAKRFDQTF